jgi:hypothetical protein
MSFTSASRCWYGAEAMKIALVVPETHYGCS